MMIRRQVAIKEDSFKVHDNNTVLKSSLEEAEDVISSMTENVVTNILNCLPIQDAVRICVLSKNWRSMWTLVTQVLFDGISRYLQGIGPEGKYCYDGENLTRLLCHLKGPVTKFVFTIPNNMTLDVEDIHHWILLLSVKGIKEITLINKHETPLNLPAHDLLFSCPELRYLNLYNCCLHDEYSTSRPTNFIMNLLSLELDQVTCNFGEIITHAPFLEILKISYRDPIGKVKLVDIAKLENLKTLHMPLMCVIDDENTAGITSSSIFQLGVYLPKLQELSLYFHKCKFLPDANDDDTKWVSTAFPCLKTLTLYPVDFSSGSMLLCVIGMIWCSPNLQTLKITASCDYHREPIACFSLELENNTMRRLQYLQHVVFTSFNCSSTEVELIKYLLDCSPLLKKIVIHTRLSVIRHVKRKFAATLLMFPQASPNAQLHFLDQRILPRRSAIDKQTKITRSGITNDLTIALEDLDNENESPVTDLAHHVNAGVVRVTAPRVDWIELIHLAIGDPPPHREIIIDYHRLILQEIEIVTDKIREYKNGQVTMKRLGVEIILAAVNIMIYVMQVIDHMKEDKANETVLALDV